MTPETTALRAQMTDEMRDLYDKLCARFDGLPDRAAPGESAMDLELKCDSVLWLIGWVAERLVAPKSEYYAEVRRIQEEGVPWNAWDTEVRVREAVDGGPTVEVAGVCSAAVIWTYRGGGSRA